MDYRVSGRAVNVYVPFIVNGEFVTPDASSVHYTLYGADGVTPDATYNNITLSVVSPATDANIALSAGSNTKSSGKAESRRLYVTFTASGRQYIREFPYVLIDAPKHSVSPRDVRAYLNLNEVQLPDEDVILPEAYWAVEDDLGTSALETALAAKDRTTTWANKAIIYRAALDLMPSLPQRILVSEQAEGSVIERQKIDFDKLAAVTTKLYVEAKAGVTPSVSPVTQTLFILTDETDPITG